MISKGLSRTNILTFYLIVPGGTIGGTIVLSAQGHKILFGFLEANGAPRVSSRHPAALKPPKRVLFSHIPLLSDNTIS